LTKGKRIFGVVLLAVTVLLLLFCIFYNEEQQKTRIERGISEALENYAAGMDESEIQMLTRDINDVVDEKLAGLNNEEWTEERLQELFMAVAVEVGDKAGYLTQEEIRQITGEILENVIEVRLQARTDEEEEIFERYREELDDLTARQDAAEETAEQLNELITLLGEASESSITDIQNAIKEMKEQAEILRKNVLYYRYDAASNTLSLYPAN
jgi:hypothetical protein